MNTMCLYTKHRNRIVRCFVLLLALIVMVSAVGHGGYHALAAIELEQEHESNAEVPLTETWIVRWIGDVDPEFRKQSCIVSEYKESGVTVARPKASTDLDMWLQHWSQSPDVLYMTKNERVRISAKANDPYRSVQDYLDQIKVEGAWDVVHSNTDITIAIIDTGVDLDHEDLKDKIVPGINLINPGQKPQDDNGHGTNVAGIIAASGNNDIGTTGIVWNTNIMPIKAIEADGYGDVDKLGEGIRYAVDHGAKIVVLSLGLYNDSPYMREIVGYAEKQGVLLVAATGNDGAEVKFPAAYPTVLAVGGATSSNKVAAGSNFGSEVDVVAPWDVIVTSLDGDYNYNEGTSMAAPQVAGVAALILAKYPNFEPYQIRNLIRQTAQDIGTAGWDPQTGYGLLRADRALSQPYKADMYEPNNRAASAKPLPLENAINAELSGGNDEDWYTLQAPFHGSIVIQFKAAIQKDMPVKLVHHINKEQHVYDITGTTAIRLDGRKGQSTLQIKYTDSAVKASLNYQITAHFQIEKDSFEDNDRQFKAYSLSPKSQQLTGTFHQINDQDWFTVHFDQPGSLRVKLAVDSNRINPAIMIQKQGEKAILIDDNREGITEYSKLIDVLPGKYYILVSNVISDHAAPVAGQYTLGLDYTKKFVDPNEPNNKAFQATTIVKTSEFHGVIDKASDVDWYKFTLNEANYVTLSLANIPSGRHISLSLLDQSQNRLSIKVNQKDERQLSLGQKLKKGTYYIRVTADAEFTYQMYKLSYKSDKLVNGYRDIAQHWALEAIAELSQASVIKGYEDATFRPNASITRAEAAALLSRAMELKGTFNRTSYSDVSENHWAFNGIHQAKQAGLVVGYENRTFAPNREITRAEMAVMLARAADINGTTKGTSPFTDVTNQHWAAPVLKAMEQEGWIAGFEDRTFKPNAPGTRAEFAWLVYQMMYEQR